MKTEVAICELCEREQVLTFHHLVPRKTHSKRPVTRLHTKEYMQVGINVCVDCHRTIHRRFDHMTLALEYYTLELLKHHEKLIKFVSWIKRQTKKAKM